MKKWWKILMMALLLSVMPVMADFEVISCTPVPPTRIQKALRSLRVVAQELCERLSLIFTIAGAFLFLNGVFEFHQNVEQQGIFAGVTPIVAGLISAFVVGSSLYWLSERGR